MLGRRLKLHTAIPGQVGVPSGCHSVISQCLKLNLSKEKFGTLCSVDLRRLFIISVESLASLFISFFNGVPFVGMMNLLDEQQN